MACALARIIEAPVHPLTVNLAQQRVETDVSAPSKVDRGDGNQRLGLPFVWILENDRTSRFDERGPCGTGIRDDTGSDTLHRGWIRDPRGAARVHGAVAERLDVYLESVGTDICRVRFDARIVCLVGVEPVEIDHDGRNDLNFLGELHIERCLFRTISVIPLVALHHVERANLDSRITATFQPVTGRVIKACIGPGIDVDIEVLDSDIIHAGPDSDVRAGSNVQRGKANGNFGGWALVVGIGDDDFSGILETTWTVDPED